MPARKSSARKSASAQNNEPSASRPVVPEGFGISRKKAGLLEWNWAEAQLEKARNYWVATTRPDGRPHVMPVWGFWVEHQFCFGTHSQTRKARNIAVNPAITVHLESGDEVVILEGNAAEISDKAWLKKLDPVCQKKYGMPLYTPEGSVIYVMRPRVAFGWREKDFGTSATRWTFDTD